MIRYSFINLCCLSFLIFVSISPSESSAQKFYTPTGTGSPVLIDGYLNLEEEADLPLNLNIKQGPLDFVKEIDINPKDAKAINHLINTGVALQWQFPDSAMAILEGAYRKSVAIGYNTGAAKAKIQMGLTLLSGQNKFDQSMQAFKDAYTHILNAPSKEMLLSALYINIGAYYSYQSNFEKAFKYYYAILQYMQRAPSDNYNLIMTYNNISDVLIHMEQYDQADYYLNMGEQLMLKCKAEDIYGFIWINMADLALARKDYNTSALYRKKALDISAKFNELDVEQSVYLTEGKYFLATNQPQKAIVSLKKAASISIATYPLYAIIAPYYTLGTAYYKAHDYKNAEEVLLKALGKANEMGIMTDRLKALSALTSVYMETGRYKQAARQQMNYIAIQDSINNKEKLKMANELEVKFRSAQKDKKIVEKELLIEKQKRDLDHKNLEVSRTIIVAIIIVVICIALYWSLKAKNRIVTMRAQMEGEEKERSRIARELHDGIGGQLAVIKMILSSWPGEKKKEVVSLLNETSEQVRQTAHNLMPDFIKGIALEEALTLFVETLNHNFPELKIDLQIYCKLNVEDESSKLSVYRMLQEVLQNIINHAHATMAVVQIFEQHGKLQLLIEDNGIGFAKSKIKRGLGMANLEARVKMMQGKIQINSAPGRGTTINIELTR